MPRPFGPSELILGAAEGLRAIARLSPQAPLLVGFGGGPDALALAWALRHLGHPLRLAFVDHGPPLDSPKEWPAAQAAAAWLGLPLARLPLAKAPTSEEAARRARHAALAEEARRVGAQAVALGHHADDQAETLLFRLLRGTGPQGAGGIAPWREAEGLGWVRPLLALERAQLREALHALGAPLHEDESNADLARARNHLRHAVLPPLEARHPGAGQRLAQAAERFRDAAQGLVAEGEAWAVALAAELGPEGALVDAEAWLALASSQQAFAWQAWAKACGAPAAFGEAAPMKAARLAVGRGEALALPGGWRWRPERRPWWALVPPMARAGDAGHPCWGAGPQDTEAWGWSVALAGGEVAPSGAADGPGGLRLAEVGPHGPWRWRQAWPEGDRLQPPGGRQQPLARHLAALGWTPFRQSQLLVLASGDEVAWVVGVAVGACATGEGRPARWWAQASLAWGAPQGHP